MMKKYALITNDLQFAAANKDEERIEAVKSFMPVQLKLLEDLRKLDVSIIHLQLVVSEDDPRSKGIPDEQKFTEGSKGVQILEEVRSSKDMILKKPKDSGFFETKLDEILKEMEIDHVIISGMQAQICVQTTAADAYFRGYKVYVPSDAVISSRKEDTIKALEWIDGYCGKVMTSNEIINLIENNN